MDHFEDRLVLAQKNPIHWIDDMLAGRVQWSRKWDGAPAIFCGRDDKGIYIAKKSIFNKDSKIYYSGEAISEDLGDTELAKKLQEVFIILEDAQLNVGELVQGDLLFTRGDIDFGYGRAMFQANTIVYSAPDFGAKTWVGIAWHTNYVNGQAHYGHDIASMIGNPYGLWHFNAHDDIEKLDSNAIQLLTLLKKEYSSIKQKFNLNSMTIDLWVTYINSKIRQGTFSDDGNINGFSDFVIEHMKKSVDQVKKIETKKKRIDLYAPVLKDLPDMVAVDKMHSLLYKMKLVILKSLNKASSIQTYLKTKDGLVPTGHEGYVAINKHGIDAVKIIDRMEFSYANFSPDVIKGWTKV